VDDWDVSEAFSTAVFRAEERGHTLGDWHVAGGNRMRACGCRLCGRLVWLVKPRGEEKWRVEGRALDANCDGGFRV
jgi:hypothetical protein